MNIVLLGAPGAGKGTQAEKIIAAFELAHVSTGDILRAAVKAGTPLGIEAKRYMDAGDLVPDSVVIGLVKDRIAEPDAANGFILDGFPRTAGQALALDAALADMGKTLDAVINIDVDRDVIVGRLTSRYTCRECGKIYNLLASRPATEGVCDACGGELYQRDDDNEQTVRARLATFDASTAPLIDYYGGKGLLKTIDGDRPVDAVFADVRAVLEA